MDAEALFNDEQVSVAPVVDTQRRLVGVITRADLARHEHQNSGPVSNGESSGHGVVKASQDGKVRDAMSQPAYVFAPDARAASVADVILLGTSDRVFLVSNCVFIGAIKPVDVLRRLMIGQSPYDQVKRMR
jgi:CBS-domain-containing membrane protein